MEEHSWLAWWGAVLTAGQIGFDMHGCSFRQRMLDLQTPMHRKLEVFARLLVHGTRPNSCPMTAASDFSTVMLRDPEEVRADLSRINRHFGRDFGKRSFGGAHGAIYDILNGTDVPQRAARQPLRYLNAQLPPEMGPRIERARRPQPSIRRLKVQIARFSPTSWADLNSAGA